MTPAEQLQAALDTPDGPKMLKAVVLQLAAEGSPTREICGLLEDLLLDLRGRPDHREADEEAVLDVLDGLTGLCQAGLLVLSEAPITTGIMKMSANSVTRGDRGIVKKTDSGTDSGDKVCSESTTLDSASASRPPSIKRRFNLTDMALAGGSIMMVAAVLWYFIGAKWFGGDRRVAGALFVAGFVFLLKNIAKDMQGPRD